VGGPAADGGRLDSSSPLPLCWIATHMEYRKNDDDIVLDREVDPIGKAAEESTSNSRLELSISQRIRADPIVCGA
jgi:hypothetical protein